jgi:hypothetical protein
MNSQLLLISLLFFTFFYQSFSSDCRQFDGFGGQYACGTGCTGTPSCGPTKCGNVANMCYCNCDKQPGHCKTTELGYKWNGGAKLANGAYALNGTKGDGKGYDC